MRYNIKAFRQPSESSAFRECGMFITSYQRGFTSQHRSIRDSDDSPWSGKAFQTFLSISTGLHKHSITGQNCTGLTLLFRVNTMLTYSYLSKKATYRSHMKRHIFLFFYLCSSILCNCNQHLNISVFSTHL